MKTRTNSRIIHQTFSGEDDRNTVYPFVVSFDGIPDSCFGNQMTANLSKVQLYRATQLFDIDERSVRDSPAKQLYVKLKERKART